MCPRGGGNVRDYHHPLLRDEFPPGAGARYTRDVQNLLSPLLRGRHSGVSDRLSQNESELPPTDMGEAIVESLHGRERYALRGQYGGE